MIIIAKRSVYSQEVIALDELELYDCTGSK